MNDSKQHDSRHIATRTVHVGHDPRDRPEDKTGAITVPIYQTSTYLQPELLDDPPYEYGRVQNPTRSALELNVASLEGGASGHAFGSGMAAISALMTALDPGDRVVVSRDVYGGTNRYFNQVLARYGIVFHWVDTTSLDTVAATLAEHDDVRMIYLETPSNPLMEITDIAGVAEIAHRHDAMVAVDNTFLSPIHQRPLELGADVVVHSATKFLNGHSDSLGGVAVTAGRPVSVARAHSGDLSEHFAFQQKAVGAIMAPFECFLLLRGLRTLAIRMERHERSGRSLASFLFDHLGGGISRLLYPGLEDHPGHAVQARQANGAFGSMISFDLGSSARARAFLEALEIFSLAESLGGVESLACLPAAMTHASVSPSHRKLLGISDGLVRLSVGIEAYEDLEADVARALEIASTT